jgi:hypothetical protein
VLCSPFLWFYARTLWDNSFMVPIVAMAFAAYADFLKAPRTWTLLVTLGCLWALPMTHLMSLSLFVPFAVHLAWFSRKELLARKGPVLALLAVLTALSWTYIRYLASAQSSGGAAHAPADAWLFPLWGAQFISAFHIEQVLGAPWLWGHKTSIDQLAETLHTVSGIALVFSWLGFYFAARDLKAAWDKKSADPRTHLAGLCLAVAAGQAVLGGLSDRYGQPHYFNGTWFAYALLAWLAVDALLQRAPVQWLVGLQGAATLGVLLIIIFRTHDIGGSRENYGATLGNQLEVVRGLLKYAPSSRVSLEISQWQRFPHAFNVLRQLEPSPSSGSAVQQPNLRIAYVAPDPTDGRIQLVGP